MLSDEDGLVVSVSSQTHRGHQSLGVFVLWTRQDRSDNTSAIMAMSVVFYSSKEGSCREERKYGGGTPMKSHIHYWQQRGCWDRIEPILDVHMETDKQRLQILKEQSDILENMLVWLPPQ